MAVAFFFTLAYLARYKRRLVKGLVLLFQTYRQVTWKEGFIIALRCSLFCFILWVTNRTVRCTFLTSLF